MTRAATTTDAIAVGIDGGQSTVRARATVDGECRSGEVDGVGHDAEDPVAALGLAIRDLVDATVPPGATVAIVAGLTMLPTTQEDRARLAAPLRSARDVESLCITSDAVTTHAGALTGRAGVALAVGTGVACLALDEHGQAHRLDGAGFLIGDEGGAFWIGSRGVRAALAANDGRGPTTTLLDAAAARWAGIDDLADRIHQHERPVATLADFATVVLDHAADGDAVALAIADDAARRLGITITAATRISGTDEVAVTGRLMTGRDDYLAVVRQTVERERPGLRLDVAAADASLTGALAIAGRAGPYAPLIERIDP
ncbi:MAG: BadF/BadG/BcrA/BcrD ATPase family protein [Ilumatobacter fluminis]|uniref:N-acetylglucosamine kinase n=1 Tax=Ilumatobacter fluminis TaxID=467091 RepID=UPI0032EE3FE0